MGAPYKLTGQTFGQWAVLSKVDSTNGKTMWLCQCKCGTIRTVIGSSLVNGVSTSCGHAHVHDLNGRVFGRLTIIERVNNNKYGNTMWLCKCGCGKEKVIPAARLINGDTRSCGCLHKEAIRLPLGEADFNRYYKAYKIESIKRRAKFGLTKKQFRNITSKNCYYCNHPPSDRSHRAKHNGYYVSNGIDRVNNDKGYTVNNCVPCCRPCNVAKSNMPVKIFKEWSIRLYENFGSKKE